MSRITRYENELAGLSPAIYFYWIKKITRARQHNESPQKEVKRPAPAEQFTQFDASLG